MEFWLQFIATLVAAIGGGYLGVKITVAVLQTQMAQVMKEIESLRESRHQHAGMIQEHEARLTMLERK